MSERFEDGPLADGRVSQIHALHVYMTGDGMHCLGHYEQVYDEDVPLGIFDWKPAQDPDDVT